MQTLTNLGTGLLAQSKPATFWLPEAAAASAPSVDNIFYFVYWLSFVFGVLVSGLVLYMAWRYRRKTKTPVVEDSPGHSTFLELTWSIIPSILVVITFYMGFKGYLDLKTPPENAYQVLVTGQKWSWNFTYPNGYIDKDLYVPLDTPVVLNITSEDVIHSFFVPAFRVKMDAVPGRYTKIWFKPTKVGQYLATCTEYCGRDHSNMQAMVHVLEKPEFDRWLEDASNFLEKLSPVESGKLLYTMRGCAQCHSVDGTAKVGPSFKGIFGHEVALKTGKKVEVEENYLRRSIVDPQADVVAGFDPVMPTYKGRLKDQEITVIIEYIKSLAD